MYMYMNSEMKGSDQSTVVLCTNGEFETIDQLFSTSSPPFSNLCIHVCLPRRYSQIMFCTVRTHPYMRLGVLHVCASVDYQ